MLGRALPFVVATTTCHRVVVVVRGKIMICTRTQFLGPILGPGQTQGYI